MSAHAAGAAFPCAVLRIFGDGPALQRWQRDQMPRISEFFGITIAMFYSDHWPPHFHARYSGSRATIRIEPPTLLAGDLPPRALGMVIDWTSQHTAELEHNWHLARQGLPLLAIAPLE